MSSFHFLILPVSARDSAGMDSEATTTIEWLLASEGYTFSRGVAKNSADEDLAAELVISDVILLEVHDSIDLRFCEPLRRMSHLPLILYGTEVPLNIWIKGLKAGSDFYIALPGSEAILRAQIRALLRRNSSNAMSGGDVTSFSAGKT